MKKPSLHVIGISYKKASASIRGKFSLDLLSSKNLITELHNKELDEKSIIDREEEVIINSKDILDEKLNIFLHRKVAP